MDFRNVKPTNKNFEDRTGDSFVNRFYEFLGDVQASVGHYAVRSFDPNNPNNYDKPTPPKKKGDWPDRVYEKTEAEKKQDITNRKFWEQLDRQLTNPNRR